MIQKEKESKISLERQLQFEQTRYRELEKVLSQERERACFSEKGDSVRGSMELHSDRSLEDKEVEHLRKVIDNMKHAMNEKEDENRKLNSENDRLCGYIEEYEKRISESKKE